MNERRITEGLFQLQDKNYRMFHAKLIPNISIEKIIGVRTPALRKYAKDTVKLPEVKMFLHELPHTYYEENNLHGEYLGLCYQKDIETYLIELERFLPYVDNWATCDMLSPKIFKKHLSRVYEKVKKWLKSEHTYIVRFAIVTLLGYYLDDAFEPEMLHLVASVESEEYYVKMAVAWYFSIALIKQYDAAIIYLLEAQLEPWVHNKAIQKAVESRRISPERKNYLRSLKIGKK